jgi:flagellar biosynthesis/type III secretory pathway protein FliH
MSLAQQFMARVEDYARTLAPDLAAAVLAAARVIASSVADSVLLRYITRDDIEGLIATLFSEETRQVAYAPMRQALRSAVTRAGRYFTRDTPTFASRTIVARVEFQQLDDRVLEAIRRFEGQVLTKLREDAQDAVREAVTRGLAAGVNPRETARDVRAAVGLSRTQAKWVANFRAELEGLDGSLFDRVLRDRRFDASVRKAIADGKPLSPEQIDRMVEAYRKRMIAYHAETVSRTASLNAMKEGQRLAWEQAITEGRVKRDELIDEWHTKLDGRERPAHHEMHGKTKRFDELWQVPGVGAQRYPGESEYNCRCVVFTRPRIRRASEMAAGG